MNTNTAGRKLLSLICLVGGVILLIASLVMDFSGNGSPVRGPFLVIGMVAILLGMYLFPTLKYHRRLIYIIFLFPLLFTFIITVIVPLCLGIFYSMTDWTGIQYTHFKGLGNYFTMFQDPQFIWSILMTFVFVLVNMILVNLIAFLLALLCTNGIKGDGFFRAAYFLPNLIGGIVLGYIWQFVFNNVLINITKTSLLVQTRSAMLAIVVVYIWQYAGYIMLLYITGLTQVPKDVLEAAQIDGANARQTLFQVKIPMIASTFTICTFLTLTSAFKQFDVNLALTGGTGSAMFMGKYLTSGTQMLALNIYNTAVSKNDYALGQAKAVLFFIILAIVSLIQVRVSNSREVEL